MAYSGSRTSSVLTGIVAAVISCSVVILSAALLTHQLRSPRPPDAGVPRDTKSEFVNRERKADKQPVPPNAQARAEIKSVEVVGIRHAAIIYRDRAGNILFRTDPVANVTIVAKNVDLPEVTIRDTAQTEVDRIVVEGAKPSAPPQGCESSFAKPSPAELTRIPSRCLTQNAPDSKLATLR